MNFAKGGPRVLFVVLLLQLLVIGGTTVGTAFFGAVPPNLPYAVSVWRTAILGAGGAALLCAYGFLKLMGQPELKEIGPGRTFALSIWGMAASCIGWIVGVGCVIASAGGWDSMGTWFFRNMAGAAVPTVVAIVLIWLAPIAVLGFLAWLWDGFSSKQE